ncbi:Zinc finger, PMZ-type [Sesbania bispinosa]|nr:Zinc finger, PMZ-type [Sesbania bispinosa]
MGDLNLGCDNNVVVNETESIENSSFPCYLEDDDGGVCVVDENWGNNSDVYGDEDNGGSPSSKNSDSLGGAFFCGDENGVAFLVGEDWEDSNDNGQGDNCGDDKIVIETNDDVINIRDLALFSPHEIESYEFGSIEVAYKFYHEYGFANGFGIRRGRTLKSKKHWRRIKKSLCVVELESVKIVVKKKEERVREQKAETRCECKARFHIHVNKLSGRWYCVCFEDEHNHGRLGEVHFSVLPSYRRMSDSDIVQMNNMMKVGIRPPNIFNTFASQSGGYEKIGFRKKDMYDKIGEQRRNLCSNAKGAIEYLGLLGLNDRMMYYEHTVDEHGRLQHLFWSDGYSQVDYNIFGEVLAFDATYGKNKYLMPLVVFSGVNSHNRSTIFAAAIIANETEETYVWLLEQFSKCMKGKLPSVVITDGDVAMKNAIERVFPNAYHRLCAWHLMRNATSNIKNEDFTKAFEDCMLGYYDVGTFRNKWLELVVKFGLEENPCVAALYEKRSMWATTYLRGKFFAGFRTTSRCEGLHSELGKFVNSRYNLSDFLQHFQCCLNHMRFKEKEDDYTSIHGESVIQTQFEALERSAAKVYTRRVFFLFRRVLFRASELIVTDIAKAVRCVIFRVINQTGMNWECRVSLYDSTNELKCACLRMESRGLPCEHIVTVLNHLGIDEQPESFVLNRLSKAAKDGLGGTEFETNHSLDAGFSARRAALNGFYNHISEADGGIVQDVGASAGNGRNGILRDPVRAATKGSGGASTSSGIRVRKKNCSICKLPGHNKVTCPSVGQQSSARNQFNVDGSSQFDGDEFDRNKEYEQFDPEMWM